jgi:hypothetical protein
MQFWHAIVAASLLLSVSACAQPPQMTGNGLPIVRDAEHRMSSTYWEVVQLPGEATPLAAITDSTKTVLLSLGCEKSVSLLMGPDKGPHLKNPSIKLAWDGQMDIESLLESFPASSGWGFGTGEGDSGFEPALTRLKQHQTLEATVSDTGIEPLRYRFSLAQADKTIDYVLGVCSKKS